MPRELAFSITTKDCTRQTFRSGGKGGQHQNKTESGVRFIHEPSGARGESREHRDQKANARAAWRRMAEDSRMRFWIQQRLANEQPPSNIQPPAKDYVLTEADCQFEVRRNGHWVVTDL